MNLRLTFFTFIVFCGASFAQGGKFKVVLDAGHGGEDPGTMYHGFVEKDIALNVVLKAGKILEDQGVQVVYTRKTDVFIKLIDRPTIANKAHANLFVSVHCNSEPKKVTSGTETFVIGPTKSASNLDVAKKENSVITLENDKSKYQGFDPNSPETIIGISIQQEENINLSIDIASKIQDNFTKELKRNNRSVKQAPFWVLHKTAMPSILIELGFVSYKPEGEYLTSESGQDEMARAIAKSVMSYKKEFYSGSGSTPDIKDNNREPEPTVNTPDEKPKAAEPKAAASESKPLKTADKGIVFKVQISASNRDLPLKPSNFKGLSNITKDDSTTLIKYFYGATSDYAEARGVLLDAAKAKGYASAFVVAFKDGKKITVQEALGKL